MEQNRDGSASKRDRSATAVVAIADEIAWRLVPGAGLAELLTRPRRRRMFRHRHVNDATPRVGQDHQHEQQPAGRGRNYEEIRRHDLSDVVRQERAPRL